MDPSEGKELGQLVDASTAHERMMCTVPNTPVRQCQHTRQALKKVEGTRFVQVVRTQEVIVKSAILTVSFLDFLN